MSDMFLAGADQTESDSLLVDNIMSQYAADNTTAWRYRTLAALNPWMSNNPNALTAMATSSLSEQELFNNASALYGMYNTDRFMQQLPKYQPSEQRAIYGSLNPQTQLALETMGYKVPTGDVEDDAFWERLGPITSVIRLGMGGIGKAVSAPVIGPALKSLAWAGDMVVGKPYRTISQLDGVTQAISFVGGAAAAAAGLALMPVTFGASTPLVIGGVSFSLGALATSALVETARGNLDVWTTAWKNAYNGERLFRNDAIKRATDILDNPLLIGVAQQLAIESLYPGQMIDLAKEVAGTYGSTNFAAQYEQLRKVAKRFYDESDWKFASLVDALVQLIQIEPFQNAIRELENGKVSIGRDIARLMSLDPGTTAYTMVSGLVDGVTQWYLDPFNFANQINRATKVVRYGMDFAPDVSQVARWQRISSTPYVQRRLNKVAEAINTRSFNTVSRYAPEYRPLYTPLLQHRQNMIKSQQWAVDHTMTANDIADYIGGVENLVPILKGIGVMPGGNYTVIKGTSRGTLALQTVFGGARDFVTGLTDARLLRKLDDTLDIPRLEKLSPEGKRIAQAVRANLNDVDETLVKQVADLFGISDLDSARQIAVMFDKPHLLGVLGFDDTGELISAVAQRQLGRLQSDADLAYRFGRLVGDIPIVRSFVTAPASLIDSILRPVPPSGIHLTGDNAATEFAKFADLFKVARIPEFVRRIYVQGLVEGAPAARLNLSTSMLNTFGEVAGFKYTQKGAEIFEQYVAKNKQLYSFARNGEREIMPGSGIYESVGVRPVADQAVMMTIPNLKEIRNATRQALLARMIYGIADGPVVTAWIRKIWTPAVLLRLGFLLRNATEEMLNFISRAGVGQFSQEFAGRGLGKADEYKRITDKIDRAEQTGQSVYLTKAEKAFLQDRNDIAFPFRHTARVLSRTKLQGPVVNTFLYNYSKWIRTLTREGIAPTMAARAEKTKDLVAGVGRLELSGAAFSNNLKRHAAALAYGNPYSLRRMIYGGVDNDMVRAARGFSEKYMHSILEVAGASNTTPWADDFQGENVMQRMLGMGDDSVPLINVRGERTYVGRNEPNVNLQPHDAAVLERRQEMVSDPVIWEVTEPLRRYYSSEIQEMLPSDVLWRFFDDVIDVLEDDDMSRFFYVLALPDASRAQFDALLEEFGRMPALPEMAQGTYATLYNLQLDFIKELKLQFPGSKVPTWNEFVDFAETFYGDVAIPAEKLATGSKLKTRLFNNYHAIKGIDERLGLSRLNRLARALSEIESVPTVGRQWLMQYVVDKFDELVSNSPLKQILARTDNFAASANTNWVYRGMTSRTQAEVLPDGTLRLFGQRQNQFPDAYALSMSYSFDQVGKYSGLIGQGLADASSGNIVVALDLNYLMSITKQTADDIEISKYASIAPPISIVTGNELFEPKLWYQQTQRGAFGEGAIEDLDDAEIALQFPVAMRYIDIPPGSWVGVRTNTNEFATPWEASFTADNSPLSFSPFITDGNEVRKEMNRIATFELNSGNWDQYLRTNKNFIDDEPGQSIYVVDTRMIELGAYAGVNKTEPGYEAMHKLFGEDLPDDIKVAIDQRQPILLASAEDAQIVTNFLNRQLALNGMPESVRVKQLGVPSSLINKGKVPQTLNPSPFADIVDGLNRQAEFSSEWHKFNDKLENLFYESERNGLRSIENPLKQLINDDKSFADSFNKYDLTFNQVDESYNKRYVFYEPDSSLENYVRNVIEQKFGFEASAQISYFGEKLISISAVNNLFTELKTSNILPTEVIDEIISDFTSWQKEFYIPGGVTDKGFIRLPQFEELVIDVNQRLNQFYGQSDALLFARHQFADTNINIAKTGQNAVSISDFLRPHQIDLQMLKLQMGQRYESIIDSAALNSSWDFYDFGEGNLVVQRDIADRMVDYVTQNVLSGRRTFWHVKDNDNAPAVYRRLPNGKPERVQPGERIATNQRFYSDPSLKKKFEISYRDRTYFVNDEVAYEGNNEILWSVIAPVMYDQALINGRRGLYQSTNPMDYAVDVPGAARAETRTIEADRIPVFYANTDHVRNTPLGELPDIEIAKVYETQQQNMWDRVVQFGFNKVISPALDAMTRKPMAFHAYANAYMRNKSHLSWLIRGSAEEKAVLPVIRTLVNKGVIGVSEKALDRWIEVGRRAGRVFGDESADAWSEIQALSFVRSFAFDNRVDELLQTLAHHAGKDAKSRALVRFAETNKDQLARLTSRNILLDPEEFIAFFDAIELARVGEVSPAANQLAQMRSSLTGEEFQAIENYRELIKRVQDQSAEYAAEHAIRDMVPYLDSHEIRSQFADHARNMLPFFYAEQNFIKRWAQTFTQFGGIGALDTMRKLQLRYMGLKSVGVIRTDANGKDYFVYPGSELLYSAVNKVFPGSMIPMQAMLQTPTDRMIPGFSPQFGAPSVSPLIGIPMDIVGAIFPEAQPLERAILGDFGTGRTVVQQIVPAQILNMYEALNSYMDPDQLDPRNPRVASAMLAALAHLDSTDQGLPDNATPGQAEDFLRRVRNHARIIVVTQSIAGWFLPGPAQTLQLPEGMGTSLDFLFGKKIEDPADVLSNAYFTLIKDLGVEVGTVRFLELNPDATIKDIFNPIAYTVSRTTSAGGAPLPTSEEGIQFYLDNQQVLDQYPEAGAWLLPMEAMADGERSQYAYDIEIIEGLRSRRTPQEFLYAMMYREGSTVYFERQAAYLNAFNSLKEQGFNNDAKELTNEWEMWSTRFKSAHPIFKEQLESGDSRERRRRVIDQMRYLLKDPLAPKAAHFEAMQRLMTEFDEYVVAKGYYALDNSGRGRETVKFIKETFKAWVSQFVFENPQVAPFWLTVLQPEAGLE